MTEQTREGNMGEMSADLISELIQNSRDTNQKVGEMHTTIFGAQGQGGLIRDHREFKEKTAKELEILQRHREEMSAFKAKLVAVVGVVATIASFFGSKIASLITKTP